MNAGDGEVLAEGIGLGGCWGLGMQLEGHREGLGGAFYNVTVWLGSLVNNSP